MKHEAEIAVLTNIETELLAALFDRQQRSHTPVNAKRFRAEFDEYLSVIEELAGSGWIEQREGAYFVQLAGVAELTSSRPQAEDLIRLCAHLYVVLRTLYKQDPERKLFITELSKLAEVSIEWVRHALPYLRQGMLFGGSSIDLNAADSYIVLDEELIRHKSFDSVAQQHRQWALERTRERRAVAQKWHEPSDRASGGKKGTVVRTPLETYTLGAQIGQGASGYVLSVKDEAGTERALKYLDPNRKTEKLLKRFRNEIRFGQRTDHPSIVPVLDVGEADFRGQTTLFFVMPRYPLTLRNAMDRNRLGPTEALRVFDAMLSGVEAAHVKGVWHRDLKPENVLLTEDLGEIRIGDFGIAHFSEGELYSAAETKAADRMANYRYAAPEQRDPNSPKDHRVDIFALGLMLNELFTGHVPHGSGYRKIVETHSEYGHLDDLVIEMIRQHPNDRLDSIESVRARLSAGTR